MKSTFQYISCTGPSTGQAVQYKYRLYEAKRDCTPNEFSPSSELHVFPNVFIYNEKKSIIKHVVDIQFVYIHLVTAPRPRSSSSFFYFKQKILPN